MRSVTVLAAGLPSDRLKYPFAKVVYLDQKDWSNLAAGYSDSRSAYANTARLVMELASANKAIFPLSLMHWYETSKDPNERRRRMNGEFMAKVSRGATVLPLPYVRELEIIEACGRLSGEDPINLGPLVLRRGIAHMAGLGTPRIERKEGDQTKVKQVNKLIADAMLDPNAFYSVVKKKLSEEALDKIVGDAEQSVAEIEKVRSRDPRLTERQRYLRELGVYFSSDLLPKIVRHLANDPRGIRALDSITRKRKLLLQFFHSMPTSNCFFDLETFRSGQMQRPVRPNDMLDLISIAVAVPYCHVVVTERMWADSAKQLRFKQRYGTDVVDSVNDLPLLL